MRISGLRRFTRRRFVFAISWVVIPFLTLTILPVNCAIAFGGNSEVAQTKSNPQRASTGSAQISGHIYRADTGAPLTKVEVGLIPVAGTSLNVFGEKRFTLTDANGLYTFTQVAAGTYTVGTSPQGFVSRYFDDEPSPADARILSISSGESLERIDIRVVAAGVISGTVFDEENKPVVAVEVQAVRIRYLRGGRRLEAPRMGINTDDLGNFRLYHLPPGNYFVRVETTSLNLQTGKQESQLAYYPGTTSIDNAQPLKVAGGEEISGIRFMVEKLPSYSVTGNVIDLTGTWGQKPYSVRAQHVAGGDREPNTAATSAGTFTIHGLTSGEYILTASAMQMPSPSQRTQQQLYGYTTIRVADTDTRANIQVSFGSYVAGRVVLENPNGKSVTGVSVGLWPGESPFGEGPSWQHDDVNQSGTFRITEVRSGNYDLDVFDNPGMYLKKVVCNGRDYTLLPITMDSSANVTDCVLTLATDAGAITGRVLDGDKPVRGQRIIAIPEERSLRHLQRFTAMGTTDANGGYHLSGVIPGDYLLFAVPPDENELYFDINFADRNLRDAERVSVKFNETKTVPLKPTLPQ